MTGVTDIGAAATTAGPIFVRLASTRFGVFAGLAPDMSAAPDGEAAGGVEAMAQAHQPHAPVNPRQRTGAGRLSDR
jgi:hypothetical protein